MNVDSSQFLTPYIKHNCEFAQTDNDALAYMLLALASAVQNRSFDVSVEEIKGLNMVDLRPLLVSGQYANVAHTVLERISANESIQ